MTIEEIIAKIDTTLTERRQASREARDMKAPRSRES